MIGAREDSTTHTAAIRGFYVTRAVSLRETVGHSGCSHGGVYLRQGECPLQRHGGCMPENDEEPRIRIKAKEGKDEYSHHGRRSLVGHGGCRPWDCS